MHGSVMYSDYWQCQMLTVLASHMQPGQQVQTLSLVTLANQIHPYSPEILGLIDSPLRDVSARHIEFGLHW